MKRLSLVLMLAGLLALGGQSFAELCTIDAVPAATLLVPYFEVDLDAAPGDGLTTLVSINNASAAPTIAHVIFWTDWSYPTIDFDIYLTGYDVATFDVRRVFDGDIPLSADPPNDQNEGSDPVTCGVNQQGRPGRHSSPCGGENSQNPHWDDSDPVAAGRQGFPGCNIIFPNFNNPVITGSVLTRLRNGHTGLPIPIAPGTNCVGDNFQDNHARGYITVDNANRCSLVLDPAAAGPPAYFNFGDPGAIANNINQLWGDWYLVDPANNFAQGDTLVHIEANDALTALNIPLLNPDTEAIVANVVNATGYTFYGRYFTPADGRDNREPLGTIWASRAFQNTPVFDNTQFIVWRDSTANEILPPANNSWCGGAGPSWFPMNEWEVISFNEAEDAVEICLFEEGFISPPDARDPFCFPWETHRYDWGEGDLASPFDFGWVYLNLNNPETIAPIGDHDFPGPAPGGGNIAQSHVTTLHSALGRFSVGLQAIELYDACQLFNTSLNGDFQNGGFNDINEP